MIYIHVKRKDLMAAQNPLYLALKKINNRDNEKGKFYYHRKYNQNAIYLFPYRPRCK
jgi:hypothetical protein